MRVVSLLPSATEILYALDVEPVGVSHECDHPPAARELPAVNRSRIDADASSAEIDAQVRKAEASDGVYVIDHERLAALDPELVLSQGICDVCAVDEVLVRDAVAELGLAADVLTTDPHSLGDVLADIERIGAAVGQMDAAVDLVESLRNRIDAVTDRTDDEGPRVVVLDWLDPPMVAGHWIPEMVEMAGGRYGLAEAGARSRPREWTTIREYDPELLIAAPCGFEIDQTMADRACLTDQPGWTDLTAVQQAEVYVLDGHHYVNRPGPRLVDTLEAFATLFTGQEAALDPTVGRPLEPLERV